MLTDFSNYKSMLSLKGGDTSFDTKTKGLDVDQEYVVLITKQNANTCKKRNDMYDAKFTKKIYEYYKMKNKSLKLTGANAEVPVLDMIIMIDYENSANIWRFKNKRHYIHSMVQFIINDKNHFWDRLGNGDVELVDELVQSCGVGEKKGPKSLASKICKYLSEIIYSKDNYYINDSVIRSVLPYYLNYYKLQTTSNSKNFFDNLSYAELFNLLEKIKVEQEKKSENKGLTRADIDTIMWYCYR